MAHYLDANQIAEEAAAQGLEAVVMMLEQAVQLAATLICAHRGDVAICQDASNEPGFGGLCVGFGPVVEGDACPEDFSHYDSSSDWAEGELDA